MWAQGTYVVYCLPYLLYKTSSARCPRLHADLSAKYLNTIDTIHLLANS